MKNFNSTLVQFKLEFHHQDHLNIDKFQFYFSPIQTRAIINYPDSGRVFQFYFSPIQTNYIHLPMSRVIYFNSTLVQFKRRTKQSYAFESPHFNSTLVQFKPYQLLPIKLPFQHFNSTLVQFKL